MTCLECLTDHIGNRYRMHVVTESLKVENMDEQMVTAAIDGSSCHRVKNASLVSNREHGSTEAVSRTAEDVRLGNHLPAIAVIVVGATLRKKKTWKIRK